MAAFNPDLLQTARDKLYRVENFRRFENLNLLWYDYAQEPNFDQMFRRIRGTQFKPNDVISIGFPRSGNHWVFEILTMIVNQKAEFAKEMMFTNAFEAMSTGLERQIPEHEMELPRIYTGHLTLDMLSENFVEKGVKVVFILRNPKDAIVSSYNLMNCYKDDKVRLDMSWEEFFELQLSGDVPWGGWCEFILRTEAFMKKHPACPVYVLVYEKLKENPEKEIRELCTFLGKPEDLASQIAKATTFSSMKEGTREKMNLLESSFWRDGWKFLSKGNVGGWKNVFTVAQNERFEKHFEEKCHGSDLASRVKEFMT